MTTELEHLATEAWLRTQRSVKPLSDYRWIKPPPALLSGFILNNTLTMISAEPHAGKTLLTLAMAISIDSGAALLGRHAPPKWERALYIGQDASTWDYVGQAKKLCRGYGVEYEEIGTDLLINEGIQVTDPKFRQWLDDWWRSTHFKVLFLDTLLEMHTLDENNATQMRVVTHILKDIRDRYDCAVIFTHHLSKPIQGVSRSGNYGARGSSVLAGSIDYHLSLHAKGKPRQERRLVELNMPKARGDDNLNPPEAFYIVRVETPTGPGIILEPTDDISGNAADILKLIQSSPSKRGELLSQMLAAEPNGDPDKIVKKLDNELQRLKREGAIKQIERGLWTV